MRYSFRKVSIKSAQHIPIISAVSACVMTGMLLVLDLLKASGSVDELKIMYECIVVSSGFFLVFCFSWIIGMCWRQLFGIIYTYLFVICLWLTRYPEGQYGAFGKYIHHFHGMVFLIGIIYCIYLFYRTSKK